MIEVKHLSKKFPDGQPLSDICFRLDKGEIAAILGPSGCGKSTLLRCLNLLTNPTGGEILLDGKNILDRRASVTEIRRKIGMVFQSYQLYPQYTVLENVMQPQRHVLHLDRQKAYDTSVRLLGEVNLLLKKDAYPTELSGGQKQRVAFARTLAMNPDVLLLDEPTSALDPAAVVEIRYILKKLAAQGKTILLVTHDMGFARSAATRVLFLHDGKVCEDKPTEQFFRAPETEHARHFLAQDEALELTVSDSRFDFLDAISSIQRFAGNRGLNDRMAGRLISAFEESVMITLLPRIKDTGAIRVRFAMQEGAQVSMAVSYGGNACDPLSGMEQSSLHILRHQTDEITYTEKKNDPERNQLRMLFSL